MGSQEYLLGFCKGCKEPLPGKVNSFGKGVERISDRYKPNPAPSIPKPEPSSLNPEP